MPNLEQAELAAAVVSKIGPDIAASMRSLASKMLGHGLGEGVAERVTADLPSGMAEAFHGEWQDQKLMKAFADEAKSMGQPSTAGRFLPDTTIENLLQIPPELPPELQQAANTTSTGRGIEEYQRMLRLGPDELKGNVLDVGAGSWQNLAYDARRAGLPANVYSVDPRFGLGVNRDLYDMGDRMTQRLIGRLYPEGNTVAASADKLPFQSGMFDKTLGLFSTSMYRGNGLRPIMADLDEMLRVTKPGGDVHLFPIMMENKNNFDTALQVMGKYGDATYEADAPTTMWINNRPPGSIDFSLKLRK